jgi:hypothetical protein
MSKKLHHQVQQQIRDLDLSYAQRDVLLFIAARTIRYGKRKEKIPERHFHEGVKGTSPCGVPRRTLKRERNALEDLPNIYEIKLEKIKEAAMNSKLKVSKKRVSRCFMRGAKMAPFFAISFKTPACAALSSRCVAPTQSHVW